MEIDAEGNRFCSAKCKKVKYTLHSVYVFTDETVLEFF